jgi:hypothetical protein
VPQLRNAILRTTLHVIACSATGSASKRGGKQGKSGVVGEAAADDDAGGAGEESSASAISSILQKALLRRVHALAAEGKQIAVGGKPIVGTFIVR